MYIANDHIAKEQENLACFIFGKSDQLKPIPKL
jgi:hypothetical protein